MTSEPRDATTTKNADSVDRREPLISRWMLACTVFGLALIWIGAAGIHWSLGPLIVGCLLWLDVFTLGRHKLKADNEHPRRYIRRHDQEGDQ